MVGEFGTGFPVFLAINANISTSLQWVIGSLTLVLAVLWIRVLAEFVARETEINWTFWGLFKSRFMLPHQREAYIQGISGRPGTVAQSTANAVQTSSTTSEGNPASAAG